MAYALFQVTLNSTKKVKLATGFAGTTARRFYVSSDGGLYQDDLGGPNKRNVVPVITLKSDLKPSSGNGTVETPYVID